MSDENELQRLMSEGNLLVVEYVTRHITEKFAYLVPDDDNVYLRFDPDSYDKFSEHEKQELKGNKSLYGDYQALDKAGLLEFVQEWDNEYGSRTYEYIVYRLKQAGASK